jgi:membrane protein involved in colicin uptake
LSAEDRKDIFGGAQEKENRHNAQVEEIEKKKLAENERLKGNECMKAKDFEDAVVCYGRALDLHP